MTMWPPVPVCEDDDCLDDAAPCWCGSAHCTAHPHLPGGKNSCCDCGLPAAFETAELDPVRKLCAMCAAERAADGQEIIRIIKPGEEGCACCQVRVRCTEPGANCYAERDSGCPHCGHLNRSHAHTHCHGCPASCEMYQGCKETTL